ncbi:MAG: hypothetical protein IKJ22_07245 [Paludibacteraceae bacterium]|nr:hypothetical protein [Paludibacteraceae bacterium]
MWASNYWTKVVTQEGLNGVNKGDTYGEKGDSNWEYIALAEGWACYRQKKMCLTYMSYIHKIPTYNSLITNYSNMYFDLKNIGVSDKQLEKSLSISNSINSFKTNLLKVVDDTNLKNLVNQKFNKYE